MQRKEDKFWIATLTALGQRLGIPDPKVELTRTGVELQAAVAPRPQRLAQLDGAQRDADRHPVPAREELGCVSELERMNSQACG